MRARIAAAATVAAGVLLAAGLGAGLGTAGTMAGPAPAPTVHTKAPQRVVFEDVCNGVKVWLANSPTGDPVTFRVGGHTYGPFPPGLTPEPLLVASQMVTVVVVETGKEWGHWWSRPAGCTAGCTGPQPGGT